MPLTDAGFHRSLKKNGLHLEKIVNGPGMSKGFEVFCGICIKRGDIEILVDGNDTAWHTP